MKVDQCQPHEKFWTARQSFQVLTQLTTWDDWPSVQKFSWGWHWSTFKNIGCKDETKIAYLQTCNVLVIVLAQIKVFSLIALSRLWDYSGVQNSPPFADFST